MASAPSDALRRRHDRIRAALTEASLDALVITSLPNILYLTNFSGSSAIAILDRERLRFITDSRYVTAIAETRGKPQECPDLEMTVVAGSYDVTLAEALASYRDARVGFESAHLTVARHDWLVRTLTADGAPNPLTATEGVIELARLRKDAYEVGVLREAGHRLSAVASGVYSLVRAGRSEREVAADIDWQLRRAGFERPAFETIVGSGPNAALPHARPSERILSEGDLVVLDFGGVHSSYCVDLTRTVALGRASDRARQVHEAVRQAQARAIAAVRPGASRFDIDAAARSALAELGMAEAFGHGTGHGLGIEVHEDPRVVQRKPGIDARQETVDVGMVFTIEPGAYFPGWGGVRIEDDVVVTDQGAEFLTMVTNDLLEL